MDGLSVCLLVTFVSPAKTAERIEMPFGRLTYVGPRNHVLDGVQIPPPEGAARSGDKTVFWPFTKLLCTFVVIIITCA